MPQPNLFKSPKGTADILPEDQSIWRHFQDLAQSTADLFGYNRIDTPSFEDAGLFIRGVGKVTDIVEKETYTFNDRGGYEITLRPEGTAPICRAYLQHGMHNLPQPVRLYYFCPVFRYERPQAGRYREHHQFGVEALGDANPAIDAEIIDLAWSLLGSLEMSGLTILLNSIGDKSCRPTYTKKLQDHYEPYKNDLCENCQRRIQKNPLRVLDCKSESCQTMIDTAPSSVEHLCEGCSEHWDQLLTQLNILELPYQIDKRLVRGFDYYTRTVFEIIPANEGRTSTIAGGGRYDGLMEELGGQPTPGIGFGMGIERVLRDIKGNNISLNASLSKKVLVVNIGDIVQPIAAGLSAKLRRNGVGAILAPTGRSLRSQLRFGSAIGATHVVIIGEDELAKNTVILRNMSQSEQRELAQEDLITALYNTDIS